MEKSERTKTNLRKEIKSCLKQLDPEQKALLDHAVCENLFRTPEIRGAEYLYAYMALSWETGTMEILQNLWSAGIRTALPKVIGSEMEFFEVRSMDDLEEGAFKILEPKEHCKCVHWPGCMVLVPGVAFTEEGHRLGKGGGYYDKYFFRYPDHPLMALAYEFQIVPEIPVEAHDQPVDFLITESRWGKVRHKWN